MRNVDFLMKIIKILFLNIDQDKFDKKIQIDY